MQKLDTNSTKSSPYLVLLHNWVTCITQLTHWPTTIIHTHTPKLGNSLNDFYIPVLGRWGSIFIVWANAEVTSNSFQWFKSWSVGGVSVESLANSYAGVGWGAVGADGKRRKG